MPPLPAGRRRYKTRLIADFQFEAKAGKREAASGMGPPTNPLPAAAWLEKLLSVGVAFEGGSIRDHQRRSMHGHQVAFLEIAQGARHCLTCRADEFCDFLVR
jgi:hypothetical protein